MNLPRTDIFCVLRLFGKKSLMATKRMLHMLCISQSQTGCLRDVHLLSTTNVDLSPHLKSEKKTSEPWTSTVSKTTVEGAIQHFCIWAGEPEMLRRHLNFRQISHRFTLSFTNPSFQDLNGSRIMY